MAEQELWYDKYRPRSFDEYVWRDPGLRSKIEGWIAEKKVPHLFLVGSPGIGKTSLAYLIIDAMGISREDTLYVKASIDNGVDEVRTKVIAFCETGGWSGMKAVVLDEADNLSFAAQQMLRTVMNDYASDVRFFYTANYAHRILDALYSRGIKIPIDSLALEDYTDKLVRVLVAENVEVTDDAISIIENIVADCYPDMRSALGELEASVLEGRLVPPEQSVKGESAWISSINRAITEGIDLSQLRPVIDGIRKEDIEQVFEYLYQNSSLMGKHEGPAIVVIADGLDRHYRSGFPHPNLAATILKLMTMQEKQ